MTQWILALMLALASTEKPAAPWAGTYVETAIEIANTTGDPNEAATLVAIAWHESRFSPTAVSSDARGRWQTSPHWGPPSAGTALRLVRLSWEHCGRGLNGLSWYHWGGAYPKPGALCRPSVPSAIRMRLAAKLLREHPREVDVN